MYVIFVHISGIALIEILFYFFYIGEMETQMFINNINHLLVIEQKKIDYSMYNISLLLNNTDIIDYYEQRAQNGENDRNKHNSQLFADAMVGFAVIMSITIVVSLCEYAFTRERIPRVRSLDSVRNICLEMTEYSPTQTSIPREPLSYEESSIHKKYQILGYCGHAAVYAGLLIAFEYWLFNYIIMKYKVISNEEIEYLFAQQIEE